MSAPPTDTKLSCPGCGAALPPETLATGQPAACPSCRRTVEGAVFPALSRPPAAGVHASQLIEGGASCFYHPTHSAQVPCDNCGRFLCSLCDLPIGNRHLCPACVDSAAKKPAGNPWSSNRFLWGRAALLISIGPFFAYPLTFITFLTAPVAVVLAALWWKKPPGPTGGGRLSLILAIVFGVAQILLWIALVMGLVGLIWNKTAGNAKSAVEIFFL